MEERGHSLESILASIEARKPDFEAYISPQKEFADLIIEVLPTKLDQNDKDNLRVRCIQKKGVDNFEPCYLFDEGSDISWVPCLKKLSSPGIEFKSRPENCYGNEAHVLEMDGKFGNIQELVYVESHLRNTGTDFYGELCQAMLRLSDSPGSDNGTGLMQTIAAFSIRELYLKKMSKVIV